MPLKPQRSFLADTIEYYMYSTGLAGGIVSSVPSGSLPAGVVQAQGAGLDSAGRRVDYIANPSGAFPIGVLLADVVDIDQSRYTLNPYKYEVQAGDKVSILTKGRVVTNRVNQASIAGVSLPCNARLGPTGTIVNGDTGYSASGWPLIGRILTRADSDGYNQVQIDL